MSTHKKPKKLRAAASTAVSQIDSLSHGLGYAAALPKAQVNLLRNRGTALSSEVILLLAKLAEQHGGMIAGTQFDAAAARDALARAEDARDVANAARRLSRRAVSESVRNLALVGDRSMAVTQAMDRIVRTLDGESFVEANDQIRSLTRAHSKSGQTRKVAAKAKATGTTSTTPSTSSNGAAIVNAPGTASTADPS